MRQVTQKVKEEKQECPLLTTTLGQAKVGTMAVMLWNIHCQFLQTQYSTKQGGQAASRSARAQALHTLVQDAASPLVHPKLGFKCDINMWETESALV